jgi:hypothetical protein
MAVLCGTYLIKEKNKTITSVVQENERRGASEDSLPVRLSFLESELELKREKMRLMEDSKKILKNYFLKQKFNKNPDA